MNHVFSIIAEESPDILARITNHIAGKGFELESIAVGPAEEEGLSRITLVSRGDNREMKQLQNILEKIINVISVAWLTGSTFVSRQLAILKIRIFSEDYSNVSEIVNSFGGRIINRGKDSLVVELIGEGEGIKSMFRTLSSYGMVEIAQSGLVAI
ncbi:acetolactate synthase small subunit [bacterium]|nr:acetolactate synthase small subunit [bacterium]